MKQYDKSVDELINLPKEKGVFYQGLLWLSLNKKFLATMQRIRREGNTEKVYDIAKRCFLSKSRYKGLLIEALFSYMKNGSFTEFMKTKPVDADGKVNPKIRLEENQETGTIGITITIYPDTTTSQINQVLKENAEELQVLQSKLKPKVKLRSKNNLEKDYKGFYIPHELGLSYKQISDILQGKNMGDFDKNAVAKIALSIQEKITASYR